MRSAVYLGEALAMYNFGASHPFGPKRYHAFAEAFQRQGLAQHSHILAPVLGDYAQLLYFHDADYIQKVRALSKLGHGYLDCGDTPVFPGVYEAALTIVGTTLDAVRRIMQGEFHKAFIPIAGLHHAKRDGAAGFCVFNDCGVAIAALRREHSVQRIAYVDIDAHHGDGVLYGFEDDADLCYVDLHEDGRYLYPGTGSAVETGTGAAVGTKLNIPMPPGATDAQFLQAWEIAEAFVAKSKPEFIILQCGADSLEGDPITHLRYSAQAHYHATQRLCRLADALGHGRVLALGGGGYNLQNIAAAWTAVVRALQESAQ
jgi:acetoin utilization protein AcuC